MNDDTKMQHEHHLRVAAEDLATAADMSTIWKPLKDAALAQGAPELRDAHGNGFVLAPFGWRAPDPDALGSLLEPALIAQLSCLLPQPNPAATDARLWDSRMDQNGEARRAMALARWGLGFVSHCGGYSQSISAIERVLRELALPVNPSPLLETMIMAALDPGWRSTPGDVSARLIALAGSRELWDEHSAWRISFAQSDNAFMDSLSDRFDIGHYGAAMVKAGADRHACAEAVAFLLKTFAPPTPSSEIDWDAVGRKVGSQLRHNFMRGHKIPETFFKHIPIQFWLGAKSEMGPASKLGSLLYQRLLDVATTDPKVKSRLCASAWMGFDRKEIEAFEARFPGQSGSLLKPAVSAELAGSLGSVLSVHRIAKTLGRPTGAWARAAFAANGFTAANITDKAWHNEGGATAVVEAMMSTYAIREAILLKAQVVESARDRALATGQKKAPALKKSQSKRI